MTGSGLSQRDAYRLMFREFPDVVNIEQMCRMLGGISKKMGYRILRENKVAHFKIGRAYKIPKASVIAYLKVTEESLAH